MNTSLTAENNSLRWKKKMKTLNLNQNWTQWFFNFQASEATPHYPLDDQDYSSKPNSICNTKENSSVSGDVLKDHLGLSSCVIRF